LSLQGTSNGLLLEEFAAPSLWTNDEFDSEQELAPSYLSAEITELVFHCACHKLTYSDSDVEFFPFQFHVGTNDGIFGHREGTIWNMDLSFAKGGANVPWFQCPRFFLIHADIENKLGEELDSLESKKKLTLRISFRKPTSC